ncbi:hypothetical protein JM93_01649 [Roseibium hamelinense]|uniref:Uncharacterized protein n=1 Tax=Roseibium hamelinense TaxID=150831 RepID=A0A562T900_9HYPH|nr:hypothetical protein [Roseibium hamelinense]MTI43760.1 hypothetical protein [Roseibium hamelinense]TWI89446.1 hypothetical protein JM93_01649 [Roseibium hamelinense]
MHNPHLSGTRFRDRPIAPSWGSVHAHAALLADGLIANDGRVLARPVRGPPSSHHTHVRTRSGRFLAVFSGWIERMGIPSRILHTAGGAPPDREPPLPIPLGRRAVLGAGAKR